MTITSARPSTPTAPPAKFPLAGLLALAVATFLSISGEMLPTGLLPEMSSELGVSESSIGLLVSVFAFTVVLTSTTLTHLTRRLPRHLLIVGLIVVLAISAGLTAIAPTYELVVASRILGGLAHGTFWAIGGAYAAHLVPREQVGRALAVAMSGGTLAFVLGVPLGTAAGQALGWRPAFGLLAALMAVGAVLVWRLLPPVPTPADGAEEARAADHDRTRPADADADADATEAATTMVPATGSVPIVPTRASSAPRRRGSLPKPSVLGVVFSCVITAVFMVGHYSFFTFIAPYLVRSTGIAESSLSAALFAFGIAGGVGLLMVGWFLGKRPRISIPIGIGVVAVSVFAMMAFEGQPTPSLIAFVVWGVTFGALPPLFQTRMLQVAPAKMRDLASAFYTTGFNAGIGGGALIGAIVLDGAGLDALPVLYIVVAVVVLGLVLATDRVLAVRSARS
ncbi:MFS transporter [Frigoribacterium sp. CFBP9039]|uniref:MFS transporter n=1 Tax=Frigoribacterium sp. CFBP9029 TaxID=3096541 RepID=UPI002A6B6DBB|nr:MFS transporter [Frigoribacterium sp. CFBP9039]MDY0945523.1 MFS transporter [Frigoribacterium sp. CFBP9039]